MLALEGLTLRLGAFALAADLTVAPGGVVALLGPSGAGKSSLLAAIAGFLTPETGRILWDGTDITALPPGDRPLSVIFQDQNLFPHLDVAQNVGLGLSPKLKLSPADRARVDAALTEVGLAGFGPRRPGDLSGGQQSRVALARALLRHRPLLLLDEPFAALGPALRAEMWRLLHRTLAAAGATALMVTHDPDEARKVADRTILVAAGRAHPPAPTAALLDAPPAALAAYLGR